MQKLMALGDDYDIVVDDSPPNYPCHNLPPPPSPSTNPLPPLHPPPRTPSPPPNSPPKSDVAKKGENYQEVPQPMQVVIAYQPEMTERGEAKVDPLKQVVVAYILDTDSTIDQPIPLETSHQTETSDYEGFMDLGFMQQAIVSAIPLKIIYPGSCSEGEFAQEVPQGTYSYIDFNDGVQLNP